MLRQLQLKEEHDVHARLLASLFVPVRVLPMPGNGLLSDEISY